MSKNYYELIGVHPSASQADIERKCTSIVKLYDPLEAAGDLNAKNHIRAIEEAYAILVDPEKRANYDAGLGNLNLAKPDVIEKSSTQKYRCPVCQSNNVQRLSIIHSSGITDIDLQTKGGSVGIGVGIASGGVKAAGLGLSKSKSRTTGTHQTELSKLASPPVDVAPLHDQWIDIVGAITGLSYFAYAANDNQNLFFAMIISVVIAVSLWAVLLVFFTTKEQRQAAATKNEEAMEKWNKSFMCLTCGQIYEGG